MDIINIVNAMQPNTISKLALKSDDFHGGASVPFMGVFVQLVDGAVLPDPAAVIAYESTYNAAVEAAKAAEAATPDIATQLANLTSALIAANAIAASDLPPEQIVAVNTKLIEIGQPEIPVEAQLGAAKLI